MGMFVHKLEGSWLKHPFWKSKFVLDDAVTLEDLRDADIDAVVIDLSKGRDVLVRRNDASAPAPGRGASSAPPCDFRPDWRLRLSPTPSLPQLPHGWACSCVPKNHGPSLLG